MGFAEILEALTERGIIEGENSGCREGGVFRTRYPNRESHDRNPRRHLHDGKEGILSAEGFGLHRNPEDREGSEGSGHPREVGGATRARDYDLQAPGLRGLGVFVETLGGAMGTDDFRFKGDLQLLEKGGGFTHGRPIRLAAHDNSDKGVVCADFHDGKKEDL